MHDHTVPNSNPLSTLCTVVVTRERYRTDCKLSLVTNDMHCCRGSRSFLQLQSLLGSVQWASAKCRCTSEYQMDYCKCPTVLQTRDLKSYSLQVPCILSPIVLGTDEVVALGRPKPCGHACSCMATLSTTCCLSYFRQQSGSV